MKKLNCWEFKKCGRDPRGENAKSLGVCKASIEEKWDGTNGGKNAGRICWLITGTSCEEDIERGIGTRIKICSNCGFYKLINEEEKNNINEVKENET